MDATREFGYHLLFFETGFFGTADDDADRAAAEGGKCSLGILVRTGSAEATAEGGGEGACTPAMDGMGTVATWGPSSSSSSSSSRGAMVERDVSGESTPSASMRSSVSNSRSLAAADAAAFLTVVEAVEAEAVLPPDEVEMRLVMTSSSSHSSSPSSASRRWLVTAAAAGPPPLEEEPVAAASLWTDPCAAAATPPTLGLGRMLGLLEAISGFDEDERRLPREAALKTFNNARLLMNNNKYALTLISYKTHMSSAQSSTYPVTEPEDVR